MKKILVTLLIALTMLASTTVVFAEGGNEIVSSDDEGDMIAEYTYFGNTSTTFYISGKTAKWTLRAGKMSAFDSATVTTTLYKKNSGSVATYTNTFYNSNINVSNSRTLTSKGTYYAKFTIKCYKGGSLKETITVSTVSASY